MTKWEAIDRLVTIYDKLEDMIDKDYADGKLTPDEYNIEIKELHQQFRDDAKDIEEQYKNG